MHFANPHQLWFLLLVPALGVFLWWAWRVKQRLAAQFVAPRLLATLTAGVSPARQKIRLALLVAAGAWLAITLARPQWGFGLEEARQRGLDIVVAIDTSKSMLADDVQPNRLTRAKLAALDLQQLAKTDRLGLVAFSGGAFLQCPLSLDDEAFRQSVNMLDVTIIPQGGTAIAEAIRTAQAAFKEKTGNHKILVLFTDGEDHEPEAVAVAQEAAKEGMQIFTIGVGTAGSEGGALLSMTDPFGHRVFIKDDQGNVVKSRLNETLLREIATATKGFYLLLAGANTMSTLYERGLALLPKSEFSARTIKQHHDRYQWFLALAIVLLMVEMFFPERKMTATNKVQTPKPAALGIALLLLCGGVSPAGASPRQALKNYERGQYESARVEFEKLSQKTPDDPRLRFNAGAAAFQSGRLEEAARQFSSSLATPELPLQQRAYYNLGNTQFRLGEKAADPKKKQESWEQALSGYESALQLEPKDDDARFNRDLVKKKLEELKQQQEQKKDKDDKSDDQKKDKSDQSKGDDQKKDDQKKPDDKSDDQKKNKPEEQKPDNKKPEDQNSKDNDAPPSEAANSGKVMPMTPQHAQQLLDAQKAEEKVMIFQPPTRTNRVNKVFKDW